MKALPDEVQPYKQSREFTQDSVPAALLRAHTTKEGTWGLIQVTQGQLLYRILEPSVQEHTLHPGQPGVVEPTVPHEVQPLGEVRFRVIFHRAPQ